MKTPLSPIVCGLLAMSLVFCANTPAIAEITWIETSKVLVVESGTGSLSYGFRNDGAEEVRITAVKSSCSCVTAASSEQIIAPGQSAEIVAVFNGKNHLGSEDKAIAVASTSGTNQQLSRLKLHVDIRPDVVLDPPVLTWAKDEPLQAKVVRVKTSHPEQMPVSITQIDGGKQGFTVTKGTTEYDPQFSVTPVSTAKPRRVLLRISVQNADKSSREIIMFAVVRPD